MGRDCRRRQQGRLLPCVEARLVHVGRNVVRPEALLAAAPDPGEHQMIKDRPSRQTIRVRARRRAQRGRSFLAVMSPISRRRRTRLWRPAGLRLHAASVSQQHNGSKVTPAARPSQLGNAPPPRRVPTTAARRSWRAARRAPRLNRYRIGHLRVAVPTSERGILAPPQPRPEDLEDPFGTALGPDLRGGEIGGGGFSGGYRRTTKAAFVPDSYVRIGWWLRVDLNHRPQHYECRALTN